MFSSLWWGWFQERETSGRLCDPEQLSYSQLFQQMICVTSLCTSMFSSLWCRWFQERGTSGSLWPSIALIFSIIPTVTSLCMFSSLWCKWFQKGETSYSLWSSTALIFSIISTEDMCHLSMYFLFSLVRMISGRGNIWQPVILNSSHILNYFNRRYVSPLYVFLFSLVRMISGGENIWQPVWSWTTLIFSIIPSYDMCHLSMYVLFSLCGWFQEGENIW